MIHVKKHLGLLLLASSLATATVAACNDSPVVDGDGDGDGSGGSGMGGEPPVAPSTGGRPFQGIAGGGLALTVEEIAVSEDGTAVVKFTIEDSEGRPIDLEGRRTHGEVDVRFILSWLGENEAGQSTQYTAYTLRTEESEDGRTEEQSSYDQDGSFETLSVGHYQYTFGTEIDITKEREGLTHSLGVFATREVDNVEYVATAVENWVPDGSEVSTILDVVTNEACNDCHTRLEFHGGARRGVEMCNLCHTESNSIDAESGNTFDFQVMIHKIHMGEDLPSVQNGTPYYLVGYRESVHDYSEVVYPWSMADCSKCHQGSQGERWITRPAEKPCSSCHDRTYYGEGEAPEGWTKHTAGPRDDSECVVCHGEDSLEPITKSHTTSLSDEDRPVVAAEILGISGTAPGQTPRLNFRVTIDGAPVDLLSDRPNRLRMRIWGPTTGVVESWSEVIEYESDGISAVECDDSFTPPCLEISGDEFVYHAATPIPDSAEGSYIVGMDGRYEYEEYGRVAFQHPMRTFAITGDVQERRQIVEIERCNSCHGDMGFHGGNYKHPAYCLNCHNTTQTADAEDIMPGDTVYTTSINLKDLLHSAHTEVLYPAPQNDCEQCHVPDSYGVPLPERLPSSTYANVTCPEDAIDCVPGMGGAGNMPTTETFPLPPESAACVSCHQSTATVAHAETNTGMSGEACATCHGEDEELSVTAVHAMWP